MDNGGNIQAKRCVAELRCEPIECVRIGFIGLGVRAKRAVHRMMHIEGCKVTALCDLVQENLEDAKGIIVAAGGENPLCFSGKEGWRELCEHDDIDLAVRKTCRDRGSGCNNN